MKHENANFSPTPTKKKKKKKSSDTAQRYITEKNVNTNK